VRNYRRNSHYIEEKPLSTSYWKQRGHGHPVKCKIGVEQHPAGLESRGKTTKRMEWINPIYSDLLKLTGIKSVKKAMEKMLKNLDEVWKMINSPARFFSVLSFT
jgi:hypothetical protein